MFLFRILAMLTKRLLNNSLKQNVLRAKHRIRMGDIYNNELYYAKAFCTNLIDPTPKFDNKLLRELCAKIRQFKNYVYFFFKLEEIVILGIS